MGQQRQGAATVTDHCLLKRAGAVVGLVWVIVGDSGPAQDRQRALTKLVHSEAHCYSFRWHSFLGQGQVVGWE